ncbi:MAG TPA: hypothetical protein VGA96_01015, partial [Fibrella sp.]
RELGIKTLFNLLGPLVNPALPRKQLVGAYSLEVARLYGYLLQRAGGQFMVVHALDGYDEISLTGSFKTITARSEQILTPQQIGFGTITASQLAGGASVRESADIFLSVLNNRATAAQRNTVVANAAMALYAAERAGTIADCIALANESLDSRQALQCFKRAMTISKPIERTLGWLPSTTSELASAA